MIWWLGENSEGWGGKKSSRKATKKMQADQLFLETILRDKKDKKVIWSSQHGFTKEKSCLMNSVTLYSEMTAWMDEERAVDIT